jgi:hypothetical protein
MAGKELHQRDGKLFRTLTIAAETQISDKIGGVGLIGRREEEEKKKKKKNKQKQKKNTKTSSKDVPAD